MKSFSCSLLVLASIVFFSCKESFIDEPSFIYDCTDTTYHYNRNNELTYRTIRYTRNGLFLRYEDLDGNVRYINYDSKNRIIKEGRINNGEHFSIEYIYGALDTISEVRYSDNTKYLYLYNQQRKLIESSYYEKNVLLSKYYYHYTYFDNVEMVKKYNDSGQVGFDFYIRNSAVVPIELDTINYYRLCYKSGYRLDSVFLFQENRLQQRRINKFNQLNQSVFEEVSFFSIDYFISDIKKWEYSQTNKIERFIQEKINTTNPYDNFYHEQKLIYNEFDELTKIEVYTTPTLLTSYVLVSRLNQLTFYHWYNTSDELLQYSKYTPSCLENFYLLKTKNDIENNIPLLLKE